jgi:hypothetical protein
MAFRNPFDLTLMFRSIATGKPRKTVKPAIAPIKRSCG